MWMSNTVMEGEFGSEFSSSWRHYYERAIGLGLIIRASHFRCRFTRQVRQVNQISIYDKNEFMLILALTVFGHGDLT